MWAANSRFAGSKTLALGRKKADHCGQDRLQKEKGVRKEGGNDLT